MGLGSIIEKLSVPLAIGAFVGLYLLERRRPLRAASESTSIRTGRNLSVAATAAVAVYLIERPFANRAALLVEERRIGLLNLLRLPGWLGNLAAVLLLDYTLYLWHVLTHRVPALWRFHVVHHADLDLDTTTGLRFHFGEIAISVAWRVAQILIIGVSTKSLRIWQGLLLPSVIFHHSNLKLPERLERQLSNVIVTPRLHGIHHSIIREETDSNWSSGLALWDIIHKTYRGMDQHHGVRIGVAAYPDKAELTLGKLLKMPFGKELPTRNLSEGLHG